MINKKLAIKYCKNDISLIENYDKAVSDTTQMWHCHHRRETIYSAKELIEIGEYYNRPACELIFLTPTDHRRLHNLGKPSGMKGKHLSAETRKKISEARKGKPSVMKGKTIRLKGTHWYNNGVTSIRAKTCPEGFVKGRMRRKERAAAKQTTKKTNKKQQLS